MLTQFNISSEPIISFKLQNIFMKNSKKVLLHLLTLKERAKIVFFFIFKEKFSCNRQRHFK